MGAAAPRQLPGQVRVELRFDRPDRRTNQMAICPINPGKTPTLSADAGLWTLPLPAIAAAKPGAGCPPAHARRAPPWPATLDRHWVPLVDHHTSIDNQACQSTLAAVFPHRASGGSTRLDRPPRHSGQWAPDLDLVATSNSRVTVEELADLFARSTGKASSSREYRGVLLAFSRFARAKGVVLCADVDFPLLLAYQAHLSDLAASTRHHRLLFLRQFLRFAERSRLTRPGLAEQVRLQPLPPHHPQPAISLDQSLRLVSAAPDQRARLLVLLLLGTGARISELLACDLSSYQDGLLYLSGKTGTRAVPLAPGLQVRLEAEILARGAEVDSVPLFTSRQGRLSDRRARELLASCCQRAGLPLQSPHDLRHAACARWLRAGIPLAIVSRTLGHSRPSTTLDHYASVTAHDLERGLSADPLERGLAELEPPL